ncbi:MAG TPA: CHRD domain-containing protein [Acidimicrobiales bacterium]|jgi:hypothetical protein|nr:CHRD domain-containing protein [Acidimicrobiales bacterium]
MIRRRLVPVLAVATAALGTSFALPAHAAVTAFSTVMTGSQEVPGPGDANAIGSAIVTLDSSTGQVCVRWHLRNVGTITAGHIHAAPAGVAGPVVVPLPTPVGDFSSGCTTASPALVQRIIDNPSNYYVNVHDAEFPGGVMRGQLP